MSSGKTDPRVLERNRLWRERNPEYMREYSARRRTEPGWKRAKHLHDRYGITLDKWDAMLVEQSGRCELCGEPMDYPVVDHDHETGRVRGLLHSGCNSALHYIERPEWVAAAQDYVRKVYG